MKEWLFLIMSIEFNLSKRHKCHTLHCVKVEVGQKVVSEHVAQPKLATPITRCAALFLPDAEVEVEGVPVAPLDVRCHDANKDYVVVTWKQPAVEGSSQILGYYIDRFMLPQRVVQMAVLHIHCHTSLLPYSHNCGKRYLFIA